jgi:protein phosphatase
MAVSNQDPKLERVNTFGEVPLARFGHTTSMVSKSKLVLFGGATGDIGKYVITNDVYSFCLIKNKWAKL